MAEDAALYWTKNNGDLAELIDKADIMDSTVRLSYENKAKARIRTAYSWCYIGEKYKDVWLL